MLSLYRSKLNTNQLKQVAVGISIDNENYDNCSDCRSMTLIGEINLANGKCGACYKPKRKYTDKQLKELIELDSMELNNGSI